MTQIEELKQLSQSLYESHHRRFIPKHPWVLVRLLPKEQRPGGTIWLPETANKVLYEGIVIETWEPYMELLRSERENGKINYRALVRESQLAPGDHILFPHFEGLPVDYLNTEEKDAYRIVRERASNDPKCEVVGKLEYERESPTDKLTNLLLGSTNSLTLPTELAERIQKEYILIPRKQTMQTVTGQ